MSLAQFLGILWARKLLTLAVALFCFAGGIAALIVVPSRWKAEADVYLNLLKPDPVTGEVIGPSARSYVATQVKFITDYSVTGLAVDKLGWLSDPGLIADYQRRSRSDTRDFRRWLAQRIADGVQANILDGSNILGITYTGNNPEAAKAIVNAVMQAYLETSLTFKRAEAIRNADWFSLQSEKLKSSLIAAQTAETNYERDNGIVMQDDKTDVDSARLAALATEGDAASGPGGSGMESQIAAVDAEIRQASATLGPNHPQLLALRAKRSSLLALASQAATSRSSVPGASTRVAAAKAAVIGNRDKLATLRILQSEVDVRRDQYNKSLAREADFRQQAAVVDAGFTPLGTAFVPQSPSFPNRPLIVGGSLGIGLILGILVALLAELLDRRVRSAEDLTSALGLPVLAVLKPA